MGCIMDGGAWGISHIPEARAMFLSVANSLGTIRITSLKMARTNMAAVCQHRRGHRPGAAVQTRLPKGSPPWLTQPQVDR